MTAVAWSGSKAGHIQFGTFLLGPDTAYRWSGLEGWEDSPAVDSGSVSRSTEHGAWPGLFLAQARTITLDLVLRTEPGAMSSILKALNIATPVDAFTEQPLVVMLDNEPMFVNARCSRRAVAVNRSNRVGLARGSLQFEASDPRRYLLTADVVVASLPTSEPGVGWPLSWPLVWGKVGQSGNISARNTGSAPAHPLIEFHGPCTTPSVTNIDTGDVLEYDLPLADTDTLYIDCYQGTATLNGTTANRLYTVTTRSVPESSFVLAPGVSNLAFRSVSAPVNSAASMKVTWRSAFW